MEKTSQLLRQERERKGLSLQAVERELRLPPHFLAILEGSGEKRFLADPLYLIPALRNYATFLDLNPTAVVQQFTAELQALQEVTSKTVNPAQPPLVFKQPQPSRMWSRLTILALALGIFAFIGHYGELAVRWQWSPVGGVSPLPPSEVASTLRSRTPSAPSSLAPSVLATPPAQIATSPALLTESPLVMAARESEPPVLAVPQPKSVMVDYTAQAQEGLADTLHLLRVQAKEETWLRVAIDDQHAKDVLLRPGQVVEWSAGAGFTLTLGNAGGVEVSLDGQGLPPFGKSGQVIRNIRLPLQG
ncbi:MAG: DUF4115 domain-containing protein [Deltaproteobacteria bacterium]|nr:DUF4115 domain-containing protein [Deltaproteobacteria bacterium]